MFRRAPSVALLALAVVATGCGASNRLDEVSLDGRRVAVTAAIPPAPRVQAGSPLEAGIDPYDPIGTAVRVGTSIEKRRQARRAQARLDSVSARVDVADRIARQALARTAALLRFAPAPTPEGSDYVLDLRISDYALVADSYGAAVYFVLLGEVRLIDPATGTLLWDAEVREREVVDRVWFGLPAAAGNVFTGRALATLSAREMAVGLGRLADVAAERIVDHLADDYVRSRRSYRARQADAE